MRLVLSLTLVAMGVAGCTLGPVVDATQFYVLNTADYRPASTVGAGEGAVLGLARVQIARYLDTPGMAIRERRNRMTYSQTHRWAESLEYGVARMLAETLRQEPAVAHVVTYPAQLRPLPDYELHVALLRAEGVIGPSGARAVFQASWELRAGRDDEVVASGQVREEDLSWNGEDYEQLAASISEGTVALSRQVAEAVEGLENSRPEAE